MEWKKVLPRKPLPPLMRFSRPSNNILLDNPETDPTAAASFGSLQPYLMVMGTPVTTEAQLMAGTGGRTITSYGSYNTGLSLSKPINPAYVTPSMQPIVTMINNGLGSGAGG